MNLDFINTVQLFTSEINEESTNLMKAFFEEVFSLDQVKNELDQTLLHYFAQEKISCNLSMVISHFLYYNHQDINGNTVIHLASDNLIFSEMIKRGASFLIKNKKGKTAIDIIIENDDEKKFASLFESNQSWVKANCDTVLKKVISLSSVKVFKKICELLPEAISKLVLQNCEYNDMIVNTGNKALISYILSTFPINIRHFSFDPFPTTEIIEMILSHFKSQDILSLDLSNINNNITKSYLQRIIQSISSWNSLRSSVIATPLHIAAEKNLFNDIPKMKCAYIDIIDQKGRTALFIAIENGSTEAAMELLKKGADCSHKCCGSSPLHEAAKKNSLSIVSLMLQKKPSLELRDIEGSTPLLVSLQNCAEDTAFAFLQYGSPIDSVRRNGNNPIHIAASNNLSQRLLRELIIRGSPVNIPNKAGKTPLMIALEVGYDHTGIIVDNMKSEIMTMPTHIFNFPSLWNNGNISQVLVRQMKTFFEVNSIEMLLIASRFCVNQWFSNFLFEFAPKLSDDNRLRLLFESVKYHNHVSASFLAGAYPSLLAQKIENGDNIMHFISREYSVNDEIFKSVYQGSQQFLAQNNLLENPIHSSIKAFNNPFLHSLLGAPWSQSNFKSQIVDDPGFQEVFLQKNIDGFTPLELALILKNEEASNIISCFQPHQIFNEESSIKKLQQFLLRGFHVSIYNKNRLSLLSHYIILVKDKNEIYDCVKLLLDMGADPLISDIKGVLPAHYAANKHITDVFELLLNSGGVLNYVHSFLNPSYGIADDDIVELIHSHDLRAHGILELYNSEIMYSKQLNTILQMKNELIAHNIKISQLIFILSSLYQVSCSIIEKLKCVCDRIKPMSCIGRIMLNYGEFLFLFYEYIDEWYKLIDRKSDDIKHELFRSKRDDLLIIDIIELPMKRIQLYEGFLNTIIRLTADSHPDYEDIFSSIRIWKMGSKQCEFIIDSYESYRRAGFDLIEFGPMASTNSFPIRDILILKDDVEIKKMQVSPMHKKILNKTLSSYVIFLFRSYIWIGFRKEDKSIEILLTSSTNDVFFDFSRNNEVIIYLSFGIIEIVLPNSRKFAEWQSSVGEISASFSFSEMFPRLIRCSFVQEGKQSSEAQIFLLNCNSDEAALAEFQNLCSTPLKSYLSNPKKEMFKCSVIGNMEGNVQYM